MKIIKYFGINLFIISFMILTVLSTLFPVYIVIKLILSLYYYIPDIFIVSIFSTVIFLIFSIPQYLSFVIGYSLIMFLLDYRLDLIDKYCL